MADDGDRVGEAGEHLAITVAEHHLRAVPERVVVLLAVVHGRDQRRALAIERIALECLQQHPAGVAETGVGLVHCGLRAGAVVFAAHFGAGPLLGVVRVVDGAGGRGLHVGDEIAVLIHGELERGTELRSTLDQRLPGCQGGAGELARTGQARQQIARHDSLMGGRLCNDCGAHVPTIRRASDNGAGASTGSADSDAGPCPASPRRIGPMTDPSAPAAPSTGSGTPEGAGAPSGIDPAELAITLKVLAELDQVDQEHPDYLAVRRGTSNMFKAVKRARRKEIRDAIADADKAVVARTATGAPDRIDDETRGLDLATSVD